ncbi:hypothetical protein LCGC14_3099080, partial [marine sediment metagenome]
MDWLAFVSNIINKVPIERVLIPRPDHTKALGEFAATMTAPVVQNKVPPEQKAAPTPTPQEPEIASNQEAVATA